MANLKITQLATGTAISSDIIAFVDDPEGTPETKKTAISSLPVITKTEGGSIVPTSDSTSVFSIYGSDGTTEYLRVDTDTNDCLYSTKSYSNGVTGGSTRTMIMNPDGELGYNSSSMRYKQDVEDMGIISRKIYDLRPVTFRYKETPQYLDYGLIAEEVAKVFPDTLIYKDGEIDSYNSNFLVFVLLNEVIEHHKEIEKLEERIKKLETKLGG